jgi:hypothetical protein
MLKRSAMNIPSKLDMKNREYLGFLHDLLILFLVLSFGMFMYLLVKAIICHANLEYYAHHLISPMLVAGVLAALLAVTANMVHSRSREYLDEASSLLKRAYDTLAQLNEKGLPKNDRFIWLTAARLILASDELAKKIDLKNHRRIYQETRMYWRGRFFDLLRIDKGFFPQDYFAESPEHTFLWGEGVRPPLSIPSITVIYRFIEWPTDAPDPIHGVPPFSSSEIERMENLGINGLAAHLRTSEKFMKKETSRPSGDSA